MGLQLTFGLVTGTSGDQAAAELEAALLICSEAELPALLDRAIGAMGYTHPAWGGIKRGIIRRWSAQALARAEKGAGERIMSRWG